MRQGQVLVFTDEEAARQKERLHALLAEPESEPFLLVRDWGLPPVEDAAGSCEGIETAIAEAREASPQVRAKVAHSLLSADHPERPTAEPNLFRLMALILPRRLWEEELGDALEVLYALRSSGAPRWQISLKISSTFAWSLVNALREVMSAVTGQAREREK